MLAWKCFTEIPTLLQLLFELLCLAVELVAVFGVSCIREYQERMDRHAACVPNGYEDRRWNRYF